jgi:hypothetical protein
MSPPEQPSRPIRATKPGADLASLRKAYLDLLKLTLADLANGPTMSVFPRSDGGVYSREPLSEELELRAIGAGWPLHGLTMVGLLRLDDLQMCVETVVADGIEGDCIETGVWRGGSSLLMRATLDSLGDEGRTVYLADSFQGLPKPDTQGFPEDAGLDLSANDFLAAPLSQVEANFERLLGGTDGIEFVPGFFDETLPALRGHRWSIIRLDGDTYEATWIALECLYPGLADGGYLIVDDYAVPECKRAVDEFRDRHAITSPVEAIDVVSTRWRRRVAGETGLDGLADEERAAAVKGSARGIERPSAARIYTQQEILARREIVELERRLAEAGEKLAELQSSARGEAG